MNTSRLRFRFIADALNGTGPFRPSVAFNRDGSPLNVGSSYLVKYARESDLKYARRNELAWFTSHLAQAVNRFVGYFSMRSPMRDYVNDFYVQMSDDINGKGDNIDVFLKNFMVQAKARGSMCLLVDMPPNMPSSMALQLENRIVPYCTPIFPESISNYEIGDDGKFNFVEFDGTYFKESGEKVDCTWRFDREAWQCFDSEDKILDAGEHPLDECPVLIFSESGDFPSFGQFSEIADISKRLFNLHSELDEILRAQTFSLLTMQVPENTADELKLQAARTAGETIGTSNLIVHTGSTPAFIAPSDGPARVYLDVIERLNGLINEIGYDATGSQSQESGVALQMRFHRLNAALSDFAGKMEDLERRMWELSRKWLGLTQAPEIEWPRDFKISDIESEIKILQQMQLAGMPREAIVEQQKRIVSIQFAGLPQEQQQQIAESIESQLQENTA
jgi:hypothetical protein